MPDLQANKDAWLTDADKSIIDGIRISIDNAFAGGFDIPFQFPPFVTTDTKNPKWTEKDVYSYEPIAIFKGSEPRTLAVKFQYVVTSASKGFSASRIAYILRMIKAYAYNIGTDGKKAFPTVTVDWPRILPKGGGAEEPKCRLTSISISYGETLVGGGSGGGGGNSAGYAGFPLVTTVNLELKLVTKIAGVITANQEAGRGKPSGGGGGGGDKSKEKQRGELPGLIKFEWF